jgi:hypothetical protein
VHASHRLNLAVKGLYEDIDSPENGPEDERRPLTKINNLMKHLGNLNPRNRLRTFTNLAPVKRNRTRWSSTYSMLKRYLRLYPFLDFTDPVLDIFKFQLSPQEHARTVNLVDMFKAAHEATILLQSDDTRQINLLSTRVVFDALRSTYQHPAFERYLAPTASIVHSPNLENAIVKIQRGDAIRLTDAEKVSALTLRKVPVVPIDGVEAQQQQQAPTQPISVTLRALQTASSLRRGAIESTHQDLYDDLSCMDSSVVQYMRKTI